jgi:tRNA threonylcarbamoyladenosine biosynthesis protein TsaE
MRGRLLSSEGSRYYTEHMNTGQIWRTDSTNLDETLRLGEAVGRRLRGGEVIELVSDLGGGKTAFVRGIARGMGSRDEVSSPSFTLNNEYNAGSMILYHFDFYRLVEPGIIREELHELLRDPAAVIVIEWAQIVEDVLPEQRLTICIKVSGERTRHFAFRYSPDTKHLIPGSIKG